MANSYIDFACVQQKLERTDEKPVAAGASVLIARFDLCPKWGGLTVYARFKHMAAVYDVPIIDGCAQIPWEVVNYTGFDVSVWGEKAEGGRLTSAVVSVPVARSIEPEGVAPLPSTPSQIEMFINKAAEAEASARRAQEANAATVKVGTVKTGAAGSEVIVTNSGTEMDAVLNFTIPKGDKGEGLPNASGYDGQVVTWVNGAPAWADNWGEAEVKNYVNEVLGAVENGAY